MSRDYRWSYHGDGTSIGCAVCEAEVPLRLFGKELLCRLCANTVGEHRDSVNGGLNQVLLALYLAGNLRLFAAKFPENSAYYYYERVYKRGEWRELEGPHGRR